MMQKYFEDFYLPSYRRKPAEKNGIPLDVQCSQVQGAAELTRIAAELHFLAEEHGLVGNAPDYFWSSIQNYSNKYQWEFVDSEWITGSLVIPQPVGKNSGNTRKKKAKTGTAAKRKGRAKDGTAAKRKGNAGNDSQRNTGQDL